MSQPVDAVDDGLGVDRPVSHAEPCAGSSRCTPICGTCRALVTDGDADMRRNYALEPAEVSAGYVLTCQTYAASETLTVDFDS